MKLFSASAYLIASLACVAASSPSDINDADCPRSPKITTKQDLDRFLDMPKFGSPILCEDTDWPTEVCPDLQQYYNSDPADDDLRREAFERLLKKLNRDEEDKLRAKWPQHVRPRDTSEGSAINSDWSGGDESSLTTDDFLQEQMASESYDILEYPYYDEPFEGVRVLQWLH